MKLVMFILLCLAGPAIADDQSELSAMIQSFDQLWIEERTYAEFEMWVKTRHYERNLKMMYWGKGPERSLVRITFPPKERGVSTLKSEGAVYNYIPKIAKTTKLTDALLSQSWMGSHLTNNDLMRTYTLKKDYTAKLLKKVTQGSREVWLVEATAKPHVATLNQRLTFDFDKKTRMPSEQKVYDSKGRLLRIVTYFEVKNFDGKMIPSKIKVAPQLPEQQGEYTEVIYSKIDRKAVIPDDTFSLTNLSDL